MAEIYLGPLESWTQIGSLSRPSLQIAVCQPAFRSFLAQHSQLHAHLVSASADNATQRPVRPLLFSRSVASHAIQLSQQTFIKVLFYRSFGYACELYTQQTGKRHLRRILAQFRSGCHQRNIETGCKGSRIEIIEHSPCSPIG